MGSEELEWRPKSGATCCGALGRRLTKAEIGDARPWASVFPAGAPWKKRLCGGDAPMQVTRRRRQGALSRSARLYATLAAGTQKKARMSPSGRMKRVALYYTTLSHSLTLTDNAIGK